MHHVLDGDLRPLIEVKFALDLEFADAVLRSTGGALFEPLTGAHHYGHISPSSTASLSEILQKVEYHLGLSLKGGKTVVRVHRSDLEDAEKAVFGGSKPSHFIVSGVPERTSATRLQTALSCLGWEALPIYKTDSDKLFSSWLVEANLPPAKEALTLLGAQTVRLCFRQVTSLPPERLRSEDETVPPVYRSRWQGARQFARGCC